MARAARPSGLRRSIVAVVAVLTTLVPLRVTGVRADGEARAPFFYDSVTGPTRGPEYLSEVGRAAFSTQ